MRSEKFPPHLRRRSFDRPTPIAKRSILSEDTLSILVPILEDIVGWKDAARIRVLFESQGLQIQEWDKVQTDFSTIRQSPANPTENVTRYAEAPGV